MSRGQISDALAIAYDDLLHPRSQIAKASSVSPQICADRAIENERQLKAAASGIRLESRPTKSLGITFSKHQAETMATQWAQWFPGWRPQNVTQSDRRSALHEAVSGLMWGRLLLSRPTYLAVPHPSAIKRTGSLAPFVALGIREPHAL